MAAPRSRQARAARRRVVRMKRVEHDSLPEQWEAIVSAWAGRAYCGKPSAAMQRDCVLPISRGGRYTLDNIVPACPSCNASKCNSEVTGWMRRKCLDETIFLTRLVTINGQLVTQFGSAADLSTPELVIPDEEHR